MARRQKSRAKGVLLCLLILATVLAAGWKRGDARVVGKWRATDYREGPTEDKSGAEIGKVLLSTVTLDIRSDHTCVTTMLSATKSGKWSLDGEALVITQDQSNLPTMKLVIGFNGTNLTLSDPDVVEGTIVFARAEFQLTAPPGQSQTDPHSATPSHR